MVICKCCKNCKNSEELKEKKHFSREVLCNDKNKTVHELDSCKKYIFSEERFNN